MSRIFFIQFDLTLYVDTKFCQWQLNRLKISCTYQILDFIGHWTTELTLPVGRHSAQLSF
jgi:hypothetical protein